jgi:hypothetical protein
LVKSACSTWRARCRCLDGDRLHIER